ncbi:hypothetical protein EON65_01335 [archaeon]|nr:MAG: hypothetical protein EON65_01335 [archaeon]
MARPRFHILKQLRLQLKSGYLKEEPFEYEIMRKFPSLTKPTNSTYRLQTVNVPYAKLYRKIVDNHPLFQTEAVYGAYAGLEPQALTLAKKQYRYIQNGMNEKDAFNKAMEYVNELENNAYVSMKKVVESVRKGKGRPSVVKDETVTKKLEEWQATMQTKSYNELTLEEQGELDYFVQTKVLGWNEVERERRMQDPTFFMRFQELLSTLFPLSAANQTKQFEKFRDDFKISVLNLHGIDETKLTTNSSFFVEDYLYYLQKVIDQPDLRLWDTKDREEFSRWIVDTLAYGSELAGGEAGEVQDYLDILREQFFPMVKMPFLAAQFSVPSVQAVKTLLYNKDIGYKQDGEKTFVKRFYRLPFLLFPLQSLALEIAQDSEALE